MNSMRRFSMLVVAFLMTVATGACAATETPAHHPGHYRVALSMSYSGNDWQGEAENLVKVAAEKEPLASEIDELKVFIAGTNAQDQISQIQAMISNAYDVIIIYPISPTALNSVIKEGCDAGIVMMTYDASVDEPCAHDVTFDQYDAGKRTAEVLSDLMGNKGNVVLITGVAGTSVDADRTRAAKAVFKSRGIKVLDSCAGDWAQGPAGQCMNRFLAAFPHIDGVWAQVGGPVVMDALKAAGRPYIPIASESENRFRLALLDPAYRRKGLSGVTYGSPPWQGAAALKLAIDSLDDHTRLGHIIDVGYSFAQMSQLKSCRDGTDRDMRAGCNAFTTSKVSDGFMADWYSPKWTPGISLQEVISGSAASE